MLQAPILAVTIHPETGAVLPVSGTHRDAVTGLPIAIEVLYSSNDYNVYSLSYWPRYFDHRIHKKFKYLKGFTSFCELTIFILAICMLHPL